MIISYQLQNLIWQLPLAHCHSNSILYQSWALSFYFPHSNLPQITISENLQPVFIIVSSFRLNQFLYRLGLGDQLVDRLFAFHIYLFMLFAVFKGLPSLPRFRCNCIRLCRRDLRQCWNLFYPNLD